MEAAAVAAAHEVRGKDMNSKRKLALLFVLATAPALALAQDHGSGGGGGGEGGHGSGGGGGCGDAFGDLVHILRDATTGQPILQKRWVELPGDETGWAYCPIATRGDGSEIDFLPMSCDPAEADAVVEVDYFGRLNGGRTKERNARMHFDEVISSIKDPDVGRVTQDETGRVKLGYDCTVALDETVSCASWRVVDSPMENLAIYQRVMRYGHFQTDPDEIDTWDHGDPAAGDQYHPALTPAEHAKFDPSMQHLLPRGFDTCFGGGAFNPRCANGERLSGQDFVRAADYLSGAANKTGVITRDLVQYLNRILKITKDTAMSTAAVETLPALIRDCGGGDGVEYLPVGQCTIYEATADLPWPASERFVDFRRAVYNRPVWRQQLLEVLQPIGGGSWIEVPDIALQDWLGDVNGRQRGALRNIDGFVLAASDGLRAIEFVHNYAIPDDLWDFVPDGR